MKAPVQFDEYYLVERVAVGGMAEVFKGVTYSEEGFERHMAVKRILPHIAEDQEFIEMFIDEAKLVSQLQHPNIPQVYHLGRRDGHYFISMEFISGQDLRSIFDRARAKGVKLDLKLCAQIVMEVCDALDYAHRKTNARMEPLNLIHRDVSPQNIIVSYDGTVKLVDFGIAKATGQINQTQAGILKGKFSYMSPEQARGYPIDARSDLFGLGAVLYEMTTLERCFLGQSDFSTIERVRNTEYRQPRQINSDIPTSLERIIRKALAKEPNHRFQSAADFQESLRSFTGGQTSREQLKRFMQSFFSAEIEGEQRRIDHFRKYAAEHIPKAQRHHDSRRFKKVSLETLPVDGNRPRFALSDQIKLSLEAPRAEHRQSTVPPREHAQQARETARPKWAKRHLYRVAQLVLLALLTGSLTAALTWMRRPLQCALLLEDHLSLNLNYTLAGEGLRLQGRLPALVDQLPAGQYVLTLTLPTGAKREQTLTLISGQTSRIDVRGLTLNTQGVIRLSSEPIGATVSLNGQSLGMTPIDLLLPLREAKLTLSAAGYQARKLTLTPEAGKITSEHLILPPEEVEWRLLGHVETARFELKISDNNWRFLGVGQAVTRLSNSETHELRVTAPHYEKYQVHLSPQLTPKQTRHIILVPNAHSSKSLGLSQENEAMLKTTLSSSGSSTGITEIDPRQAIQVSRTQDLSFSQQDQKSGSRKSSRSKKRSKTRKKRSRRSRTKTTRQSKAARTTPSTAPSVPKDDRQPGFLKLIAIPPAKVFIDGRFVGWTPLLNHKLPEGQHSLKLKFQTGEERVISQLISAGRVSLRRVRK